MIGYKINVVKGHYYKNKFVSLLLQQQIIAYE